MAERDANGRWLSNKGLNPRAIGKIRAKSDLGRLKEVWRKCFSKEDMIALRDNIWDLAFNATDERVRLGASIFLCDHLIGKPTESIAIDSEHTESLVISKLDKEQQATVETALKVIRGEA